MQRYKRHRAQCPYGSMSTASVVVRSENGKNGLDTLAHRLGFLIARVVSFDTDFQRATRPEMRVESLFY